MNGIMSITALKREFESIVRDLPVEAYFKAFHTTPQHDGSPHVEVVNGSFDFVVTERGMELERKEGLSDDEVLYLLLSGITHHMATRHELENRKERTDWRVVGFPYQEALLGRINPTWGERIKREHEAILREHPYRHE